MTQYLLAIDQGTTSSRAMIFDEKGQVITSSQKEFMQFFPHDGWVEHDGLEIIDTVKETVTEALNNLPEGSSDILALGITNQRETTLIWDRERGVPIYPAIVWQDRRTADLCQALKEAGHEQVVSEKTGLLLDPYFSATKIKWILDNVAGARARAEKGELAFGTVDSFILWHLTGGKSHATDVTNASRTMLYNIHDMAWDDDLLQMFDVPPALLPSVHGCDHHFGYVEQSLFGQIIPITGMAGDQQAALIGQDCLNAGQIKCTYGTGGFIMMNTGESPVKSQNKLLTTVAYQIQGRVAYALEGSFFCAGAAVQWLRDGLKIIKDASETEALARSLESSAGVYMVPAFTGLGAPHWDPHARGALYGLTRSTGVAEIARATLEAVGFQTSDLLEAMAQDANLDFNSLKVDGGMTENGWLLQFLADIMQLDVIRPQISETTAYGAALLAGIGIGLFKNLDECSKFYDYHGINGPLLLPKDAECQKKAWVNAVKSTRSFVIT